MQEGILQVGKIVYDDKNALYNLIKNIDIKDKKDNYYHIIQINFNTKNKCIEIKDYGEMHNNSNEELLWIGTATGAVSPQWYTTGNKLEYLISQTIPNIISMNLKKLSSKLQNILNSYYYDMGEQKGLNNRYRYVININKINNDFENIEEIYNVNKKDVKKTIKDISKRLDNYIKDELGLKTRDISLYFLSIDDEPVSNNEDYREAIKNERYGLDDNNKKGHCSVCSSTTKVSDDTSKLQLKFYTTTNINFPSNFSKGNYEKNMQICENCMTYLMTGEQYIIDNLNTKLAGMPVYIIPHFLFDPKFKKRQMDNISKGIKDTFNQAKNVEEIVKTEDNITNLLDLVDQENYYLLNILFYKINQKSVKVQRLIKDVNPSRFTKIILSSKDVQNKFKKLISYDFKMPLGLQSIYYLNPVKIKDREVQDFRNLLSIYDSVFKGNIINKEVLIKGFINMMKIHYFNKEKQFNIQPNKYFSRDIIQSNMLIKLLEEIGCLKEGDGMDIEKLDIYDHIKDYIEEMNYSEEESSLFLLGYLVAQVGNRQHREREGKKPILNKINFNSMDLNKIKRLSSEIVEKLRQNDVLKYNEKVYFAHKTLLDKHISHWNLSKHDNLYYIMSGYAYGTTKAMMGKENKND
ncbi:TIGR02556 family CRISPR-associated protein [Clostridium sp. D2Q-14]|uniref:TIGR02556 family CRISPR-associated protein n=1 Tax=Anaeromonas gelatinilytica TaxID=2683194 RepID=UPI00193B7111|nr:TIGR02556 family CRISPR-associated protein [Anaeromonas gelatinilytica]MBS4535597.1 TIGR02556 family CRISPR-associated protein [Anaeromonas gelatinilytica]